MKNSRRILCLFLALCVVSVCPLNALAVSDNGENMEISGEQVYIVRQGELLAGDYEILADGEWTFVERTEHTITWEQATGTAVVTYLAGQIAGKVSPLGFPLRAQWPGGKFCVSVFRQNQEYHIIDVHNWGLFPLVTAFPGGWDGMRAGTA